MKRILLSLLATFAAQSAFAGDLPGVVTPPPIVQPMPEPEDQPADQGAVQVGDWDVKVSGSVTVDIGGGSAVRPQR
jgi:hypothetical protein